MGMFNSTSTAGAQHHKTLVYGHHGWGKTYQCRFYAEEYGKGLIISGESGLAFLSDVDIDYVEFHGWDGNNPELSEDQYASAILFRWFAQKTQKEKWTLTVDGDVRPLYG